MVFISNQLLIGVVKHTCCYEKFTDYGIKAYHEMNGLPGLKKTDGSIHLKMYALGKKNLHVFFTAKKEFNAEDTYIIVGK